MEQKLRTLIKEAMIQKREDNNLLTNSRYQTLKNILETAQKIAKERRTDITDTMIIEASKKEIKQLNDLFAYCKPDSDKAKEIIICKGIATELLPKMATEEEITLFVKENKTNNGNIGTIMKALKERFGDSLDGKMASNLLKTLL